MARPRHQWGQAAGDGYCAVADVLGRDQALAPSPDNPLDGTPELIIVHAGGVQVLTARRDTLRDYPWALGAVAARQTWMISMATVS